MRFPIAASPRLFTALCLLAPAFAPVGLRAQTFAVTLTPAKVAPGSPELIRVEGPASASLDGTWLGRKLLFFRGRQSKAWFALAGVDVEAATGASRLRITAHLPQGTERDLSRTVFLQRAPYRKETLSVAPGFVSPDADAMAQIKADTALKQKVFAASSPEPLWTGSFRAPVSAAPTDSFGVRRMFNGKLASVHKGMDYRAKPGTPVRAGNSGVVVLARPLYFEGNCVIIDHGAGLLTLSMHFSRIDVKEGQQVAAGDQLGLSGATGRVTGPHLHWAVRWQGAFLDPEKLLNLDLSEVR